MLTFNFKKYDLNEDGSMLDVGCGEGRHIFGVMQEFPKMKCIGLDMDNDSLKKAEEGYAYFESISDAGAEFMKGSAYSLPFSDNTFDLIVCSEVLEHVPNFEKVLKECHRILKPGAVLLISVPTYFPESLCWKYSKKYMQTPGGHIRIFKNSFLLEEFNKLKLTLFKHHREHAMHSLYWIFKARNNMEDSDFLRSFHELLVKQMFGQAKFSYALEKILNPFFGKSECYYLRK